MTPERIPPQDIAAERAALGCMLLEEEARLLCAERLKATDFYRAAHQAIFDIAAHLPHADELQVADKLGSRLEEAGGADYVHELATSVPSTAHVDRYIQIITKHAAKRRLLVALQVSLTEAEDGETFEVVEKAKTRLDGVAAHADIQYTSFRNAAAAEEGEEVWPLSLLSMQQNIGGLRPGGLILISGGEGAGKTTLLLQILVDVAQAGHKVYVWSKDQPTHRVARLAWSGLEGKPVRDLAGEAPRLPIYFDEGEFTLSRVAATMRRAARGGTRWFALDYLSLLDAEKPFRAEWEGAVYAGGKLKLLAEELNVYVLVIQSATEQESDSAPRAKNVFGGRQLRHHADQVWWLQPPAPKDRGATGGTEPTILYVFKNRYGPVCKIRLDFLGAIHRFAEWR